MIRCEEPNCYGPATVEIVALWRTDDGFPVSLRPDSDTVTVVGVVCDDDRASVLKSCRMFAFSYGYTSPTGEQRKHPMGVYVRYIDDSSREM